MSRRLAILLPVLLVATLLAPAGSAIAADLPAPLVASMEAEISRTNAALEAARTRLSSRARAQQTATADAAMARDRAALVRDAASLGPLAPPTPIADALARWEQDREAAAERANAALERETARAAAAQARALDAERRLRALRRASATEDERDATLGSWRFGSGGAPVSAASLDAYLAAKGSPMAGQGAAFLEAGVEQEIDPRLLVAIAGAESYFGIITCAPHNAWGWGCPTSPFRFDSWADAIHAVARGLREHYLDSGRTTVGEIHLKYAPPNAANDPTNLNYAWPDNVARFLVEQGGDPQAVAGVVGPSR